MSYGRQGTAKHGVKPNDHAIIYTEDYPPGELVGERRLHKAPIRVVPFTYRDKLHPASRINYSKMYTVEHNVKVCFIGKIHPDSEHTFERDFRRTAFGGQDGP